MDYSQVSENLVELNKEIIEIRNSKEYLIGKRIMSLFYAVKHKRFLLKIKEMLSNNKIKKYNKKNIDNDTAVLNEIDLTDKKVVVYTCITGGYDKLYEPLYNDGMMEYVAYLDTKRKSNSAWNIKEIPSDIKLLNNNILINRYIKFRPNEIFAGYDYSIYIDGNLKVVGDLKKLISFINPKTGLAFHRHSCRNSIYDEAKVLEIKRKGNIEKIKKEIEKIKKTGFPYDFGLYEANVIVTDLKNVNSEKILYSWFEEFKKSECERDQIILPYIVWKLGFNFNDIGNLGMNVHQNPYIKKNNHNNENNN